MATSAVFVDAFAGQPSVAELDRRVAAGESPRKDYVELARALDAVVVDEEYMTNRASRLARRVFTRVDRDLGQIAEAAVNGRRYEHLWVYGDRRGLPIALLRRPTRSRATITVLSQWVGSGAKRVFLERLGVASQLNGLVFSNEAEADVAVGLGVPREKVHVIPGAAVDDRFWRPEPEVPAEVVSAVGWSGRDWPTFLRAVPGLDARIVVDMGAAIPPTEGEAAVSARVHELIGEELPPNVEVVDAATTRDLRDLYARSRFVVVPVSAGFPGAGMTTIVEALAMGKAVVTMTIPGALVDLIRHDEHALYVPPGDVEALRAAIARLLDRPDEAERLGRAGRELVERELSLDAHVARAAAIVRGA
jgi:glycosyltransferase involved in cell wall biosynthesis